MANVRRRWTDDELQDAYGACTDLIVMGRWREAGKLARTLIRKDPVSWRSAVNAGGQLIESAQGIRRRGLILEAIQLIESALPDVPDNYKSLAHYNLANGYLALGQRERGKGPATRPSLSAAITHLDEALTKTPEPSMRTNLANALSTQGRIVEALDEYNDVLAQYPEHHEALANRAVALEKAFQSIQPHHGLMEVAVCDVRRALELAAGDAVREEQYRGILRRLNQRVAGKKPSWNDSSPQAKWIWTRGLNLNLCPYCAIESPEAFDQYALSGLGSDPRKMERSEQILDMLNAIHRSYSVARWQLLQGSAGIVELPQDHVVVLRGAQDARHDLATGLLVSAASGFYSVLNQVGSALNAYFDLKHDRRWVDLARVWWELGPRKQGVPRTRSELHPKFQRRPSPMLSALHRLALSLEHGNGRYAPLRKLRNDIEHHVVVVRQYESTSCLYECVTDGRLAGDVTKLGRISKAALLYLGGALWMEEYQRLKLRSRKSGIIVPGTQWVDRM